MKEIILDNLDRFKSTLSDLDSSFFSEAKYSNKLASYIKKQSPVRFMIKEEDVVENTKKYLTVVKHLINSGVEPSKIKIMSLDECYLMVRGFGSDREKRNSFFDRRNQLIVITNMRAYNERYDVWENIKAFWADFFSYCESMPKLHILLVFRDSSAHVVKITKLLG